MSDYTHLPGGALKIKGVADGGIKKYEFFLSLNTHLHECRPITQEKEIVQIPR